MKNKIYNIQYLRCVAFLLVLAGYSFVVSIGSEDILSYYTQGKYGLGFVGVIFFFHLRLFIFL